MRRAFVIALIALAGAACHGAAAQLPELRPQDMEQLPLVSAAGADTPQPSGTGSGSNATEAGVDTIVHVAAELETEVEKLKDVIEGAVAQANTTTPPLPLPPLVDEETAFLRLFNQSSDLIHVDGHAMLVTAGAFNESCAGVCARRDLVCHPKGFAAANRCDTLRRWFGCRGDCDAFDRPFLPAAEYVVGQGKLRCQLAARTTWPSDDAAVCHAVSPDAQRVCPCGPRDVVDSARLQVADILRREQQFQSAQLHKLQRLSHEVQEVLARIESNKEELGKSESRLKAQEQELERLRALEATKEAEAKELAAYAHQGTTVDYETGAVHLDTGKVVPQNEAAKKLAAGLTSEAAMHIRDPARFTYDFILLTDVGWLLLAGAIGGLLAARCHMPPALGYMLGGSLVGPSGLSLVEHTNEVGTVALFGCVFPVFFLGMRFRYQDLKQFYRISVIVNLVYIAGYAAVLSFLVAALKLTDSRMEALLVGLGTALASTGVTIGNLQEHGLLFGPSGQLCLSILALQDLIMSLLLALPHGLVSVETDVGHGGLLLASFMALIGALSGCGVTVLLTMVIANAARWAPRLSSYLLQDSNHDTLALTLVGMCMAMALITSQAGLSLEMGAFSAGLALAWAPEHRQRALTLIEPLSRVFGSMFFSAMGMLVSMSYLWRNLHDVFQGVVLVTTAKFCIMLVVVHFMRVPNVSAVVVSTCMTHITEYSLLLSGKAHAFGLMSRHTYLLWLTVAVMSTAVSPLLVRLTSVWIPSSEEAARHKRDASDTTPIIIGLGLDAPISPPTSPHSTTHDTSHVV